jgi:hypothetical protein
MVKAGRRAGDADQRADAMLENAAQALHGGAVNQIEEYRLMEFNVAVDRIGVKHRLRL